MPIYEFYCSRCDTIYHFFSRSVNTTKVPMCPRCRKVRLKKKISMFNAISGGRKSEDEPDLGGFDEAKMERAIQMLEREASGLDEDDPRQAAQLMRKLTEATGLKLGSGMEEALSRMERGEDPDKIEAEMGDLLEEEEPFVLEQKSKGVKKRPGPKVDETLYDL
ncbi:MAG TPA: zinc ribbon domain-containing protein [Deltaproteobacteria bacterium]|nr:zinc ribbon domain-containing protein [Deltaproteobacteria bacterium]HPP79953.1 zinc ribbon domain-containing protein [Deltaproteobacteria bacterium]